MRTSKPHIYLYRRTGDKILINFSTMQLYIYYPHHVYNLDDLQDNLNSSWEIMQVDSTEWWERSSPDSLWRVSIINEKLIEYYDDYLFQQLLDQTLSK